MKLIRAWQTLTWITLRRLVFSTNMLMVLFPLVACGLFIMRRHFDRIGDPERAFNRFSDFLLMTFVSFLVPICALAFGTASVGGDREDRTLVFLLIRPVPRSLILLAKYLATIPITLGLVLGSFWIFCRLAGVPGMTAFRAYLPIMAGMALAYLGLFHLFAVMFRHATIVALVYALFMELLLGNLPGIIKRVAINYYGRSLIYAAGAEHGLKTPKPQVFEPLSADTAAWCLFGIAAGSLLLAMLIFSRREYRDLT